MSISGTTATITLQSSGVIHASGSVSISPKIVGNYSITKTGTGTLTISSGGANSTFSGVFILDGGVVNTYGSGVSGNTRGPFGTGTLTLRSGQIRAQGSNARSYYNPVALDGGVILGDPGYLGEINISAGTAGSTTTLLKDSTITLLNYSNWNQAITGNHNLTKSGTGALALTHLSNSYTGKTYVTDGALFVTGALLNSEVEIQSGAILGGTSASAASGFYREVVVKSGGRLLNRG